MVVNAQKPTGRLAVCPVRRPSKDGSALCIIAKADAVKELMPVKSNKSSIRWTRCSPRAATTSPATRAALAATYAEQLRALRRSFCTTSL